jgi:hypothetical protein
MPCVLADIHTNTFANFGRIPLTTRDTTPIQTISVITIHITSPAMKRIRTQIHTLAITTAMRTRHFFTALHLIVRLIAGLF